MSQCFPLQIDSFRSKHHDRAMITPAQSRAARGLIEWSQSELATRANLGLSTVRNFEKGRRVPSVNNLAAIRQALESAGIVFIPENGEGAGVRLRKTSR
jgi:transcriptional regulator with XRE-family HTH domain